MTPWIVGFVAAFGVVLFLWWLWSLPHPDELLRSKGSPVDPEADTHPDARPAGPGAETQSPDGRPSGGDGYPAPPQS
ncbi:MAG TPA: hypothetical protein VLB67_06205 [Acidimicrobiia bacterium]|nr:hypothetical protein [Acidimicrobiia bacterium]